MQTVRRDILLTLVPALLAGCGTIVGNPKQPKGDGEPKPSAVVYELPLVDFDVGDAALDESAGFRLAQEDAASGDRSILKGWGARVDRIVARVNALSERVTKIAAAERESGAGDTVVFSGRGADGKLSGRLAVLPDASDYDYEAVLCHDGKPFTLLQWTKDKSRFVLQRDFAAQSEDGEETFELESRITGELGTTLRLAVETEGLWTADADGSDLYLAESTVATRDADGMIELKAVADRGAARPAAFEGDSYLVARLTPNDDLVADRRRMTQEFVGYDARYETLCQSGFDETAPDLWRPDVGAGTPRFCLGRPAGAKRFETVEEFHATLTRLEPIGLQPASSLGTVDLPEGLSCE